MTEDEKTRQEALIERGVILTALGSELLTKAQTDGRTVQLKSFGVGDGGSNVYVPTYDELRALTTLPGEWDKRKLDRAAMQSDGGFMVEGLVPYNIGAGRYVNIFGIYTSDDELMYVFLSNIGEKPASYGNLLIDVPMRAFIHVSSEMTPLIQIDTSVTVGTVSDVTLSGDTSVMAGTIHQYNITNFCDFSTYEVEVSAGTVSRSGSVITLNVPTAVTETITLTVWRDGNSFDFSIGVEHVEITAPVITAPASGAASVSLTPTFISSEYSSSNATDLHSSTDWQLSTTAEFADDDIAWREYKSQNLRKVTLSDKLDLNTTYYVRCRYYSSSGSVSAWSESVSFTTNGYASGAVVDGWIVAGQREGYWYLVAPATRRGFNVFGLNSIDTELPSVGIYSGNDPNSGEYNTDILTSSKYRYKADNAGNTGCPAANECKQAGGWLPNIQDLVWIYQQQNVIDAADPSGGQNTFEYIRSLSSNKLIAISSSESEDCESLGVNFKTGSRGAMVNTMKYWIIPCKRVKVS